LLLIELSPCLGVRVPPPLLHAGRVRARLVYAPRSRLPPPRALGRRPEADRGRSARRGRERRARPQRRRGTDRGDCRLMRKVLIAGAAGRDFHNFNVAFRGRDDVRVVAFTATQIPDIEGRVYPAELAGPGYSDIGRAW